MSISIEPDFRVVDAILPTNLLLPGVSPTFQSIVIAPGQFLPHGAVIGIATTGANAGMASLSIKTATDGTQYPIGIIAMPVAAFLGDGVTPSAVNVSAYRTGKFSTQYLHSDPSWTALALRVALMNRGILTDDPGYSG